jgi:hypothetical protein
MTLSGSISPLQRYQMALNAGWDSTNAVIAAAISLLECGNCDMSTPNATKDYGIMQINQSNFAGLGLTTTSVADPQTNFNAGFKLWSGSSSGWRNWCTYPYNGCNLGNANPANYLSAVQKVTDAIIANGGAPVTVPDSGTGGVSDGGSGGASGGGGTGTTSGTGNVSSGTEVGTIAGFPINIPSGMVLGLIAIVILFLGVLLFATNFVSIGPVHVGTSATTHD